MMAILLRAKGGNVIHKRGTSDVVHTRTLACIARCKAVPSHRAAAQAAMLFSIHCARGSTANTLVHASRTRLFRGSSAKEFIRQVWHSNFSVIYTVRQATDTTLRQQQRDIRAKYRIKEEDLEGLPGRRRRQKSKPKQNRAVAVNVVKDLAIDVYDRTCGCCLGPLMSSLNKAVQTVIAAPTSSAAAEDTESETEEASSARNMDLKTVLSVDAANSYAEGLYNVGVQHSSGQIDYTANQTKALEYFNMSAHESCAACPAGKFSTEHTVRNRRCKKCRVNTYAANMGASSCDVCPAGSTTRGKRGRRQCFD